MKKILVAAKEPWGRALLRAVLQSAIRCEILEARDAEEAVLVARLERPLLVVLDGDMGRLTGYEVCRALKADPATASSIVLLVTASTHPFAEQRSLLVGAEGFFRKPLSPLALQARVKQLVGA